MNIWGAVKGVLRGNNGKSGADNVMKVAGGIGGWIDGLKLTDQEKMEFDGRIVGIYADYMKSTADENTERSITRRSLALWIIKTEIFLLLGSVVMYQIDQSLSAYMFKVATHEPLNYLVLGVGAFFFGAHLVRATKGK